MYFEYFHRPRTLPSHQISGLNRNLATVQSARLALYKHGDQRLTLLEAMRENALLFNLDRTPTTGLMGMELLAEELPGIAVCPDSKLVVTEMRNAIEHTGALYRRTYLDFLEEIATLVNSAPLCNEAVRNY